MSVLDFYMNVRLHENAHPCRQTRIHIYMQAYHMHLYTLKKQEVLTCATTWVSLEDHAGHNKPVAEEDGLYDPTDPRPLVQLNSSGQKGEHWPQRARGGKLGYRLFFLKKCFFKCLTFFRIYFSFQLCLSMCAHRCRYPLRPEEGLRSPGAVVTGICELSKVGARK